MTVLIHNELVSRLLREGEGVAELSALPRIDDLVGEDGTIAQRGGWVPLLDALRAIVLCAQKIQSLSDDSVDRTIGVDKSGLEQLLIAVLAVKPAQTSLRGIERATLDRRDPAELRRCHAAAVGIAGGLRAEPRMPFERYSAYLDAAPERSLTLRFLSQAGRNGPTVLDGDGELAPIVTPLPTTVPAQTKVELVVEIVYVDDQEGTAIVRRIRHLDAASESVLLHHQTICALRFDGESIERADLTAAHYLGVPLKVRAAAECALLPGSARRSSLTLIEVLEAREVMDAMHRQSRPFGLQLRLTLE
jgi:hypothetical protein